MPQKPELLGQVRILLKLKGVLDMVGGEMGAKKIAVSKTSCKA